MTKFRVELQNDNWAIVDTTPDKIEEALIAAGHVPEQIPAAVQQYINTTFGTLQERQNDNIDYQARLAALNAAIAATENDLAIPGTVNLAVIQAIVTEINALRNRQNGILKAIRYLGKRIL